MMEEVLDIVYIFYDKDDHAYRVHDKDEVDRIMKGGRFWVTDWVQTEHYREPVKFRRRPVRIEKVTTIRRTEEL